MKKDQAPQDKSKTYGGLKKLLYVVNDEGEYETITSDGWEVEELVTSMAVEEINQLADEAKQRAIAGESAPLEYYMYSARLDLPALAQAVGFFQWRVKRHMQPKNFSRLSDRILARYADVLGMDINKLKEPVQ